MDGQKKIKTNLGGFMTLVTIIIFLLFSYLLGKDILYKQNPFFYSQNKILPIRPSIHINTSNFPIAWILTDLDSNLINEDGYLNMTLNYVQFKMKDDGNFKIDSTQLKLKKCEYQDLPNLKIEEFDLMGMYNYTCPDNLDIKLYGFWSEGYLSRMSIELYQCDYEKYPEKCANKSEIERFIKDKGVLLSMLLIDYEISITNFTHPITPYFNSPHKSVGMEFKNIEIYLELNKVLTDSGIIFDNFNEIEYVRAFEYAYNTAYFSESSKKLIQYDVYSSNVSIISNRKYIKLSEILASVGGLLKIFQNLFCIINSPICIIKRNMKIIESFFIKTENLNHNVNYPSDFNMTKITSANTLRNKYFQNRNDIKEKIKLHIHSRLIINLSFSEKLLILFGIKKNNRIKISNNLIDYRNACSKINYDLDILNIFKVSLELNNLKKFLLQDYEKFLLESVKFRIESLKNKNNEVNIRFNLNDYISYINFENIKNKQMRLFEFFN